MQFGTNASRNWQVGHLDLTFQGKPHTLLLVTLHKAEQIKAEYRYADRFTSPEQLEWESQDQTSSTDAKGRYVIGHEAQGRTVHLFVRFHGKTREEAFTYCGTLTYQRHLGEKPMRVWWGLKTPLPRELWRAWTE